MNGGKNIEKRTFRKEVRFLLNICILVCYNTGIVRLNELFNRKNDILY